MSIIKTHNEAVELNEVGVGDIVAKNGVPDGSESIHNSAYSQKNMPKTADNGAGVGVDVWNLDQ